MEEVFTKLKEKVEKALKLLYEDFDLLSESECYRYDLSEIMRQIVSNHISELCGKLQTAKNSGDLAAFQAKKAEFLAAFDLLEEVTATQQDLTIGEWVGSAADWATDTGADDFAYEELLAAETALGLNDNSEEKAAAELQAFLAENL